MTYMSRTRILIEEYASNKERFSLYRYADVINNNNCEQLNEDNYKITHITSPVLCHEELTPSECNFFEIFLVTQVIKSRTATVVEELTKLSNYDNSHIISIPQKHLDLHDVSSENVDRFQGLISLEVERAIRIIQAENNGIQRDDLVLVLGLESAFKLGYPKSFCGIDVVVECSVNITQSNEVEYIWPRTDAVICIRPDTALKQRHPTSSACVLLVKKEVKVDVLEKHPQGLVSLSITEENYAKMISPKGAVIITNLLDRV